MGKEFIKFLFVGGINTLFSYGVYSLFLFLNFHYAVAALLGTIFGILFNFKTTGLIVFKSNDNSLIKKFFFVYAFVYAINVSFLKVFAYFNINLHLAGFVLLLPMALLSFFLMKKFVFKGANV